MELRHLRYFVTVAEELHFSRAAERLHISPPSLTQQIQNLERELGTRLFTRNKRSVTLTDAGTRFLDEARLTLQQAEHAALVARLAGRGDIGRLEIGYASSAACAGLVTAAVAKYCQAHPLVTISLSMMQAARQLEHLTEGRLDIGFLRNPARYPVGITAVIIAREPVLVVLPTGHRLAKKSSISAQMLAEERFLAPVFETEIGLFQHTAALAQEGNFVARIVERVPDIFTTVTLVAAGAGIAIVPQSCSCLRIPGTVYKKISQQTNSVEFAVAFRRDERAPAVKAFIQQLRSGSSRLSGGAAPFGLSA
jgi:DNA-binding transcriptional LysR family regulator